MEMLSKIEDKYFTNKLVWDADWDLEVEQFDDDLMELIEETCDA